LTLTLVNNGNKIETTAIRNVLCSAELGGGWGTSHFEDPDIPFLLKLPPVVNFGREGSKSIKQIRAKTGKLNQIIRKE
jgi:hypothetical protein